MGTKCLPVQQAYVTSGELLLIYYLHLSSPGYGELGSWLPLIIKFKLANLSDYNPLSKLHHIYFQIISRQMFPQHPPLSFCHLCLNQSPSSHLPSSTCLWNDCKTFITMLIHCLQPQFRHKCCTAFFFHVSRDRGHFHLHLKFVPSSEIFKPFSF